MEAPDILETMPRTCGDCEYFEGTNTYKTLGCCSIWHGIYSQVHGDGMPTPFAVEALLRATTDANACISFEWSEESRVALESAVLDGYIVTPNYRSV